jgi:hypothetical protein
MGQDEPTIRDSCRVLAIEQRNYASHLRRIAGSGELHVTSAQVLMAKLAVELSEEDGEEPDEALVAIANAKVVDR